MSGNLEPFMNPASVASYADDTPNKVPALAELHRMTELLLAEVAQGPSHMLVVGAGGGLELKAMAQARQDWHFTGVDPSPVMLDLAQRVTAPYSHRIKLITGTVDQAAPGPYDGATCLLTLHFLDRAQRVQTLREIHRRLKPGRAIVVAHHTAHAPDPERWLSLSAAFADRTRAEPAKAAASAKAMAERLPLLRSCEEGEVLREAGFEKPALFYAAFSFRGWVAAAAHP